MRRFGHALLIAVTLTAVAANATPKDELMATDKAFSDLSVAQGAHAAFLAYMADDVRLYDGERPPILGKAAAAAYYAKVEQADPNYKNEQLEWTPVEAEASPDGMLGWTRGTWVFTAKTPDGGVFKLTGYYATEWRRQADGHYKFELDIGGADKH